MPAIVPMDYMALNCSDAWTAVLFYMGTNKERGRYRCLSTWHQQLGENARNVVFNHCTVVGKVLRPDGLRRIDFWTPFVQRHRFYEPDQRASRRAWTTWKAMRAWSMTEAGNDNRGQYVVVYGLPGVQRRHATFVNGEWVNKWELYMR